MIESMRVFARRRFHRQKAHLVLSAMRHRAAEVNRITVERRVSLVPARGFATSPEAFGDWADGRGRLAQDDSYRRTRRELGILMDGARPAGDRWNFDRDNREPPPEGRQVDHFLEHRLPHFGPHEDAVMSQDPWMAHSLLSAVMNLGLVDPADLARHAEQQFRAEEAPLASFDR